MPNNPFLSETFSRFWLKHFNQSIPGKYFPGLPGLSFIKSSLGPVYVNTGKTHTKGISYCAEGLDVKQLGHKVLLIYDLHHRLAGQPQSSPLLGKHIIKQYPGFYIELSRFTNLNDLLIKQFSKSSRYKFRKYKGRLEASFDIRYKMFHGNMNYEEYLEVFESFHELLRKRFDDKGITNNNLDPEEWNFYKEVVFPLILEKKAALFVVYHGTRPIAVSLVYLAGNWLIDAIRSFDSDFAKFHLGTVSMMALIDWCIANRVEVLDFSKGYFDYKEHWSTHSYSFEYHVLYNPGSPISQSIALLLKSYFKLKQWLREKGFDKKLHKFTYRWKFKAIPQNMDQNNPYSIVETDPSINTGGLLEIDVGRPEYRSLRMILYEVLYLHGGTYETTKIFATDQSPASFVIKGDTGSWELNLLQN